MSTTDNLPTKLGRSIESSLSSLGAYALMTLRAFGIFLTNPPHFSLIREQLFSIGIMSLPIVSVTGLSTGMVLAAQSFFQLADKGLEGSTGIMVGKALMTELSPVLTGFIVAGRVGSAMCAEIGTMFVTEQIDAMRSMSVNPLRYLVTPRIIASTIMMPFLHLFCTLTGILGGYLVATYLFGMAPITYFGSMQIYITNFDFMSGFAKSFIFGVFVASICCYKGMRTKGGALGVGSSTTSSVVTCYAAILIFNFLLTLALNMIRIWFYRW